MLCNVQTLLCITKAKSYKAVYIGFIAAFLKAICLQHIKWSHLRCIYANNLWFLFAQNKTNLWEAFPICVCWAEHIVNSHLQMLAMYGYPVSGPPLHADIPSHVNPSLSAYWSLSLECIQFLTQQGNISFCASSWFANKNIWIQFSMNSQPHQQFQKMWLPSFISFWWRNILFAHPRYLKMHYIQNMEYLNLQCKKKQSPQATIIYTCHSGCLFDTLEKHLLHHMKFYYSL